MVEISEIDNRDALEEWLDQAIAKDEVRGREIAVTIVSRAGARGMPLWWHHVQVRKGDLSALPILRGLLISSVVAKCPTEDMKFAAARAYIFAAEAAEASDATAFAVAADAAFSATEASDVVYASAAIDALAATEASDAAALWSGVKGDLTCFDAGDTPFSLPLWPQGNPLSDEWDEVKETLNTRGEADKYAFWIWWYDGLLNGTAPSSDHPALREIALIPDEDWKDEDAVLEQINGIWRAHFPQEPAAHSVLEKADDGVLVLFDTENAQFYQSDALAEQPVPLQSCVDKLREAIELIDHLGNLKGVLKSEVLLINMAIEKHASNPVMVHNNSSWALELLDANLASEACPPIDKAPELTIFRSLLMEVRVTLSKEPLVLQSQGHSVLDSKLLDDVEVLKGLEDVAEEIAEHSDEDMAAELPEVAKMARDQFLPRPVRMAALARAVSLSVQTFLIASYKGVDALLKGADGVSKRVESIARNLASTSDSIVKISKNAVKVGAIAGGSYSIIQGIAHSEKIIAVIDKVVKLF